MTQSSPPQPSPSGPEDPWTVRRLLDWIRKYLGEKDVDSPRVCAELLLGHVLGCERLRLYMTPEAEPTPQQLADLRALVARAAEHEPVQYLVGSWPFHGREFERLLVYIKRIRFERRCVATREDNSDRAHRLIGEYD